MARPPYNNPLDKLAVAKFRKTEFLVANEAESNRGRKTAIHDYPNSGKRLVQDLGQLPSTFDVTAVVSGEAFLSKAIVLKNALDQKGVGVLVLPHLGALNVVALPYNVDYSHKSVGVIRFTLKFTLSNTTEVPAKALASAQDVIQKADEAREASQEKFAANYKKPIGETSFIKAALAATSAVSTIIKDYSSELIVANAQIQGIVRDFQSDVSSIIVDPQLLAEKLIYGNTNLANGLFASLSNLLIGPEETLPQERNPIVQKVLSGIKFGQYAFTMSLWPNDTGDRIDRNVNRVVIVESVWVNTLLVAFEVAASYDYDTTEDIIGVTTALEEAYTTVMLSGDPQSIYANDNDFKILIDDVKATCFDVLDQKLQQAYSISEYYVGGTQSIMGLTYRLYAENFLTVDQLQDFAENIVVLNTDQIPTEFSGNSNVFEVV
jgi:prophage DNA circulation protein